MKYFIYLWSVIWLCGNCGKTFHPRYGHYYYYYITAGDDDLKSARMETGGAQFLENGNILETQTNKFKKRPEAIYWVMLLHKQ